MVARSKDERRRSAAIVLDAMDVLEAATTSVSPELVVPAVRDAAAKLDEDQLRAAVVVIAVEAVWSLPPALVRPRTAAEIRGRLAELRRWIERTRLVHWWEVS